MVTDIVSSFDWPYNATRLFEAKFLIPLSTDGPDIFMIRNENNQTLGSVRAVEGNLIWVATNGT